MTFRICLFATTLSSIIGSVLTGTYPIKIEDKKHVKNFDAQSSICKPVTPPCFKCTTPTKKTNNVGCSDPVVTFKYECPERKCAAENPCKSTECTTKTCSTPCGCRKKSTKACTHSICSTNTMCTLCVPLDGREFVHSQGMSVKAMKRIRKSKAPYDFNF